MKHTLWWETANVSQFTLHCNYRFPSFVAKVRIIIAEYKQWFGYLLISVALLVAYYLRPLTYHK